MRQGGRGRRGTIARAFEQRQWPPGLSADRSGLGPPVVELLERVVDPVGGAEDIEAHVGPDDPCSSEVLEAEHLPGVESADGVRTVGGPGLAAAPGRTRAIV